MFSVQQTHIEIPILEPRWLHDPVTIPCYLLTDSIGLIGCAGSLRLPFWTPHHISRWPTPRHGPGNGPTAPKLTILEMRCNALGWSCSPAPRMPSESILESLSLRTGHPDLHLSLVTVLVRERACLVQSMFTTTSSCTLPQDASLNNADHDPA